MKKNMEKKSSYYNQNILSVNWLDIKVALYVELIFTLILFFPFPFGSSLFLNELKECRDCPSRVGKIFVNRVSGIA